MSILIAVSLLLTPFTGVMFLMGTTEGQGSLPSDYSNGDRVIGSDYAVSRWNITTSYTMNGNLTIRSGGVVTVTGGGLVFAENLGADRVPYTADDKIYYLIIEDGGKLILRNSTITTNLNQLNAFPSLGVIVRNGGVLEANDSTMSFPGHMIVDDSTLTMWRSTITGNSQVGTYCNSTYFPAEVFQYAPVLLFMSSTVNLYDSSLPSIYQTPSPTANTTEIYANMYNHNYPFVTDHNVGVGGARSGADYNLLRTAAAIGSPDTTGQEFLNLLYDDLKYYQVNNTKTLWIEGFDTAGLVFNAGEGVTASLNIQYYTGNPYVSPTTVQYQNRNGVNHSAMAFSNTPINPVTGVADQRTASFTLPAMSSLDMAALNVSFANDGGQPIYINKVWISLRVTLPTYTSITLAGNTSLTAVNSYFGVDFSDKYNHNTLVLRDGSMAYLYGVAVDTSSEKQPSALEARQPAFVTIEKSMELLPYSKSTSDNTGQPLGFLTALDSLYYDVGYGEVLEIDGFNTTNFKGPISAATLTLYYLTGSSFSKTYSMQWSNDGVTYKNTSIIPDTSTVQTSASFNLNAWGIQDFSAIDNLRVRYVNGETVDSLFANKLSLSVTLSPTVYIYRWANLTVTDNQDLPVNNATVSSVLQSNGVGAYYYTPAGGRDYPSDEVLLYLNADSTHYAITDNEGKAEIPLLSELLNKASPNPYAALAYDVTATYLNSTGAAFANSTGVSFNPYPDLSAENTWKVINMTLPSLALELPDLTVLPINLTPSTVYEAESIQIAATVHNRGKTTATKVDVHIIGYINGVTPAFWSNQTIESIAPGTANDVPLTAVTWSNVPAGQHTISVIIDPAKKISEENKQNNVMSTQITVLANLAELSLTSADITFNPQPATTNDLVTATIYVNNTGRAAADNATVKLYAGSIASGGQFIGSTVVTVANGAFAQVTYSWKPTQIGTYPIYVYINNERSITEYDYTNNTAFKAITVTITIDGSDLVVGGSQYPELTIFGPNAFNWAFNVTVIENGTLTLNNTLFTEKMDSPNQLKIVVKDNGTLNLVDGSMLSANNKIDLYLMDHANLTVIGSSIQSNYRIIADDMSSTYIVSSVIGSDLVAPGTSHATVVAQDTTFDQAWSSFGGHAVADVTNIAISGLNPQDNAVINHYRWVYVTILDGTGEKLPNAYVAVTHPVNGLYASGITDADGTLVFRVLTDVRTPGMTVNQGFLGSYFVNTTYTYQGQGYDGENVMNIGLIGYTEPLARISVPPVRIAIPGALPDLDPPLYLSTTTPARNQTVVISTEVSNVGVVPAHNVLVMFNDTGNPFYQYTIPVIQPGQMVYVNTTWIAGYPLGVHNISVAIDPFGNIRELNNHNNDNSTLVTVMGIADLSVQRSDVTLTPASPVRGQTTTITAVIRNSGDIAADNVLVSFYATAPNGIPILLGNHSINEIGHNDSGTASISWTPLDAGDYTIRILVDGLDSISETTNTNNDLTFEQNVLNYADLIPTQTLFNPASPTTVNTNVSIEATIKNLGEISASGVIVRFYVGDTVTGTLIDEQVTGTIGPGQTQVVKGNWNANITPGLKTQNVMMTIWVNPQSLTPEINYNNNWDYPVITVNEIRPDVFFPEGINITSAGSAVNHSGQGETVVISTFAGNAGNSPAMATEFVFYAKGQDNQQVILGSVTKDVGVGQSVLVNMTWLINVTMGDYTIVINANPEHLIDDSNITNDQVSVDFIVDAPNAGVTIDQLDIRTYKPGTNMLVTGRVANQNTSDPIAGAQITVYLAQNGVQKGAAFTGITDANGNFMVSLYIPEGLDGDYQVHASVTIGDKTTSGLKNVTIKAAAEGGVPWYMYLIILAVIAAAILFFSAWLYKYGLGKMVECGECGSLISDSSKRCPKCGVEFEVGTAKCSECGAWIPSNSTSCPECNAKFITDAIEEEEDAYLKKMREQYDAYVDTFREEARKTLGKKYSDAKFPDWWKKQPTYVSFESWLSQEEEKRKVGGTACSSCGTLNPRGSTICHKCGSTLEMPKVEAALSEDMKPDAQQPKPLRRIVRRPVEKKAGDKPSEEPKPEEDKPQN